MNKQRFILDIGFFMLVVVILLLLSNFVSAKPYTYACPKCDFYLRCDSDSMYPALNCTNTQVMDNAKPKDLKLNQIVWVIPEGYTYKGKYIVHRIVGRKKEGWLTKGDNNNETDPWILKDKDIKFIVRMII